MYPKAKSVVDYVAKGWQVVVAYIVGFSALDIGDGILNHLIAKALLPNFKIEEKK